MDLYLRVLLRKNSSLSCGSPNLCTIDHVELRPPRKIRSHPPMPMVRAISKSSRGGLSEMALKLGETPRDRIFLEGPTSLVVSSVFPLIHLFCKGGKRPNC